MLAICFCHLFHVLETRRDGKKSILSPSFLKCRAEVNIVAVFIFGCTKDIWPLLEKLPGFTVANSMDTSKDPRARESDMNSSHHLSSHVMRNCISEMIGNIPAKRMGATLGAVLGS
jgi:hypothetical protein